MPLFTTIQQERCLHYFSCYAIIGSHIFISKKKYFLKKEVTKVPYFLLNKGNNTEWYLNLSSYIAYITNKINK